MFNTSLNPYKQAEFYDQLLEEIQKYFSKSEFMDNYRLYKLHLQIYEDYMRGYLDYDWRKRIKEFWENESGYYNNSNDNIE